MRAMASPLSVRGSWLIDHVDLRPDPRCGLLANRRGLPSWKRRGGEVSLNSAQAFSSRTKPATGSVGAYL